MWTLGRLVEACPRPYVWIDWSPDAPPDLFGGRTEGFFTPVLFGGDTQRLAFDGTGVLLTMVRNPEGKIAKITPVQFPLNALRFKREDIDRLARAAPGADASPEYRQEEEAALAPQTAAKGKDESASGGAVFRSMEKLTADEITIAFVGDRAESGLEVHNRLEISARGVTRRVGLEALDLVDRRRSPVILNKQCSILWMFAQRHHVPRGDKTMPQAVSRLGKLLSKFLGIDDSLFELRGSRWVPRFAIADKRGAANERAKRDAERRTFSYERWRGAARRIEEQAECSAEAQTEYSPVEQTEYSAGEQTECGPEEQAECSPEEQAECGTPIDFKNDASQDYPFDSDFDTENDAAAEWLTKYDPSRSA